MKLKDCKTRKDVDKQILETYSKILNEPKSDTVTYHLYKIIAEQISYIVKNEKQISHIVIEELYDVTINNKMFVLIDDVDTAIFRKMRYETERL